MMTIKAWKIYVTEVMLAYLAAAFPQKLAGFSTTGSLNPRHPAYTCTWLLSLHTSFVLLALVLNSKFGC